MAITPDEGDGIVRAVRVLEEQEAVLAREAKGMRRLLIIAALMHLQRREGQARNLPKDRKKCRFCWLRFAENVHSVGYRENRLERKVWVLGLQGTVLLHGTLGRDQRHE